MTHSKNCIIEARPEMAPMGECFGACDCQCHMQYQRDSFSRRIREQAELREWSRKVDERRLVRVNAANRRSGAPPIDAP